MEYLKPVAEEFPVTRDSQCVLGVDVLAPKLPSGRAFVADGARVGYRRPRFVVCKAPLVSRHDHGRRVDLVTHEHHGVRILGIECADHAMMAEHADVLIGQWDVPALRAGLHA